MKQALIALTSAIVLSVIVAGFGGRAADIARTRYARGQSDGVAKVAAVGDLVFPSAVAGTRGTALEQVDEVVEQLNKNLAETGLGIGNMLQHTIYLKDGAAEPIQVLQRFHAATWKLAPSLKDKRSVGTIVRVPSFPNENTAIMVDMVASNPGKGKPDDFKRIPFIFGPPEIAETYTVGNLVFTAGTEAMDFEHRQLPKGIDAQIEAIVKKLQSSLQKNGLTVGNMISHNLYVTKGTDPLHVIQKFHEEVRKLAPQLADGPSVGTLAVVDGMAAPGFLLEMDAVAAIPPRNGKPGNLARVPFTEMRMDIAKSVSIGDLVFLSGMEGMDFSKKGAVSPDVMEQAAVAAKKVDGTLRKSGLSIADMIKYKLYVKKGAGDPVKIRDAFMDAAIRMAPALKKNPSAETLIVVEGLAADSFAVEASVIAARRK